MAASRKTQLNTWAPAGIQSPQVGVQACFFRQHTARGTARQTRWGPGGTHDTRFPVWVRWPQKHTAQDPAGTRGTRAQVQADTAVLQAAPR